MIRLSTLLLAPPVGERLRARYDDYRQHGASWLSASLGYLVGVAGLGADAAGDAALAGDSGPP